MTAPRACRACGAPLDGHVRWCLRCYEPARELTPRAAVWAPGEFVDAPAVEGPSVSHWSRWDKSATTMGPRGRILATLAFVLTLPGAASAGAYLYLLCSPVVAFVVLPAIWARGWVVPADEGPRAAVTRPPRPQPHPDPPLTRAMIAWRVAWTGAVFVACLIFAYVPSVEAKAAVLGVATIAGMWLFWRGFFSR